MRCYNLGCQCLCLPARVDVFLGIYSTGSNSLFQPKENASFFLSKALFSSRKFFSLATVIFLFVFSNFCLRPCLVPKKFCKIFQIPRHIESLDVCMKY